MTVVLALIWPATALAQQSTEQALLTEDTLTEFAAKLVEAIESGDLDACRQFYDTDAFVEGMFEGLEFRYSDRGHTLVQWKRQFSDSHALYRQLVTNSAQGGSFRLLAVHPSGRKHHFVFRLLDADGTLSYHLYNIARGQNGRPIINDATLIGYGSQVEAIRNMVAHFTPYDGPDGRIHKSAPNAEQLIMDKRLLSGMIQQFGQKNYYNVCYFYEQLSPKLQRERFPLLLTLSASAAVQPDPAIGMTEATRNDFSKSLIERFRAQYADDPAIDLVAIDYYVNAKLYDAAIRCVDALDEYVGGDSYLDSIRAGIYVKAGKPENARQKADAAVGKLHDIPQVYVTAADVAVRQQDFERAVTVLDEMAQRFDLHLTPESFDDPAWTRFFSSEQNRKWQAHVQGRE